MSKAMKSEANKEFHPKTQWDTYANLLYKLGRVSEAIIWEQKALDDLANESGQYWEKRKLEYQIVIEKMKKREPTYVEQGSLDYHYLANKMNFLSFYVGIHTNMCSGCYCVFFSLINFDSLILGL